MKITDTTGRTMLVDLVYPHPQLDWLTPDSIELAGRSTIQTRMPYGRYAIRICSQIGADVILFENGRELTRTSVGPQTQFIQVDSDGNALEFVAPDTARSGRADVDIAPKNTAAGEQGELDLFGTSAGEPVAPAATVPTGNGNVFLVVRFAKTNSPFGEPPQEEFELNFQMRESDDFDLFVAQNLRLVKTPGALPNPLDPLSFEPPTAEQLQERPNFDCTFRGHRH